MIGNYQLFCIKCPPPEGHLFEILRNPKSITKYHYIVTVLQRFEESAVQRLRSYFQKKLNMDQNLLIYA